MARVSFTSHLEKHLHAPTHEVNAATLREALEAVFRVNPQLQGYILDDQGRIRQHVAIFVDNQLVADRSSLHLQIAPDSEIYIMQALSGG